jgi:hypothetical protein
MSSTTEKIILAIFPPTGKEVHIQWEGHDDVETAKTEIEFHRKNLIADGKLPYDYYIYKAVVPEYGNRLYQLDEVDMNFYTEKTPEEKEVALKKFEAFMADLKVKAGLAEPSEVVA